MKSEFLKLKNHVDSQISEKDHEASESFLMIDQICDQGWRDSEMKGPLFLEAKGIEDLINS